MNYFNKGRNKILKTQLPEGVRDYLFQEAALRRAVDELLTGVFRQWGYREVVTPTFEFLDAMQSGMRNSEEMYRFFDRRGRLLALRPDMTTPIARLAATKLAGQPKPIRLFYSANIFRYDESRKGRPHEIHQIGIELLGVEGPKADAEVIAVALEGLKALGLSDFKLVIGHVGFPEGIMEACGLDEEDRKLVRLAFSQKNYVELEEILATLDISGDHRDLLRKLRDLHGQAGLLEEARYYARTKGALQALENLSAVCNALDSYGMAGHTYLDLSLTRELNYYTGIVFEGYAAGAGSPICGGGRYDLLIGEYGNPRPATGFALSLEEALKAIIKQKSLSMSQTIDYLIVPAPGKEQAAFARARELRRQGLKVELEIAGLTEPELQTYIHNRKVREIIRMES